DLYQVGLLVLLFEGGPVLLEVADSPGQHRTLLVESFVDRSGIISQSIVAIQEAPGLLRRGIGFVNTFEVVEVTQILEQLSSLVASTHDATSTHNRYGEHLFEL